MSTESAPKGLRFPAEWEGGGAVMIAWPHEATDWASRLREVDGCYVDMTRAFVGEGLTVVIVTPEPERVKGLLRDVDERLLLIVEMPTNDTWTRDYGPLTVEANGQTRFLDFRFNGWGRKFAAEKDNRVTALMVERRVLEGPLDDYNDFVFEGGSVESDGRGTIMVTSSCLLAPNRNEPMGRAEIEALLKGRLGARQVLWVDHGHLEGDDTDGHIDTIARLAPNDTIVYTMAWDPGDSHYAELDALRKQLAEFRTLEGRPFNLVELPLPAPIHDEEGERLPAGYANYLVTDTAVFMPTYDQPRNDECARMALQVVFPDRRIIGVDCRELIRQHGSLHCATMQLPAKNLCI